MATPITFRRDLARVLTTDEVDDNFLALQTAVDAPILVGKTLTSPKESKSAPSISGGTLTLDLAAASVFDVPLNAAITTLTLSNIPVAGTAFGFTLTLTADGTARAVTWPATFKWPGGTAPTLTSATGKKDTFFFFTTDGGTIWQSFVSGQNL